MIGKPKKLGLTAVGLVVGAVAAVSFTTDVQAALPEELERTELVSGLNQPTAFRQLPDGRILITEKGGAIKVFQNGAVGQEPLITLAVLQTDNDEERGLLGLEPDPDFAQNGYLYVSYTSAANRDRLSRITVTGNTADPESEVVLIESNQDGNIYHHGGEVRFGPDGKLYWAMGMNTFNPNSQDLSNVHGKILRMNKDGSAPPDNPFVNTPDAIPQIWAYGLRNPFRFTFAPNGKLLTGDVGGSSWEEVNVITKGGNYGWPAAEGTCASCPYVNPIFSYAHTPPPQNAGSITSAMVYTGTTLPEEYRNKFFYADYTLHYIKYLTLDSEYSTYISDHMFDDDAGTVVQLDQGLDGNIYQLNIFPGVLYKIAPSGGNRAPKAVAAAGAVSGYAPLDIQFSSDGSSDPDQQPLSYAWDFGDGTTSTEANPSKTYTADGVYNATLTVSDGAKTGQATVKITVGSKEPVVTILTPADQSKYDAGDTVSFSGSATDPDEADLPDSAYSWKIDFHHADHIHPFRDNITGKNGSVELPRSADNIDTTWYRLYLTVTDSSGLKTTKSVDIKPNLVNITWTVNQPDGTYTIDGIPKSGTYSEQAVVGVERALGVPSPQFPGEQGYIFSAWSDGLPQSHTIITPATDTTYSLTLSNYAPPPAPWQSKDIGSPNLTGYASYDNGSFTVAGSGGDIWGTVDQFHYLYQPLSGDGEIIARTTSQTNTDPWAKSGVMIKQSAEANAPYALLAVTPENGIKFQHNFSGESGSASYEFPNAWLKLKRTGDLFEAFTSADGSTWTKVGETTIAMGTDATAGLAVTSHSFDPLINTTTFDNVQVNAGEPAGQWQTLDVGDPITTGSSSQSGNSFELRGGGSDIWGDVDQFRYTYQPLSGDGEITARVTALTDTESDWAKAGVMIKQSATAGSPYALLAVTPEHGINFQHSFASSTGPADYTFPNAWLRLKRAGSTITAYTSANGSGWTQLGTATIDMGADVTIGLFVTSNETYSDAGASFDNVTTSIPEPGTLPAPWAGEDVGEPPAAGSSSYANGTFTVSGSGSDIWGGADQFHFVHQAANGDATLVARVTSQSDTDPWAKAGIMVKQSTAAGSNYALLAVTPGNGVTFQRNFDAATSGGSYTFPDAWLKLARSGNTVTASVSADGVAWTPVDTVTVTLDDPVRIGLFVTSHDADTPGTATFDNVTVDGAELPTGWSHTDIGDPATAGSAAFADHIFTIAGAGNDIWGTAGGNLDQFHYAYQTLEGNGTLTARVTSQSDTGPWAKAGVMVKQSATAGSPYALLGATPGNGLTFQDNFTNSTGAGTYTFPDAWLRLTRAGNTVTAFTSADGGTWTQVGTATVMLTDPVTFGLFVTSHNAGAASTATFDNVSITVP